ncbi:MAG: acetate--CoA ligase [Myxococcales bacterium]|nr:acetate--CoA ligase [Myxococcales bacterium]
MSQDAFTSVLEESRSFPPPADFAASANLSNKAEYEALRSRSLEDPEGFWAEIARDFHWYKPFDTVLEWNEPHAKWFLGGKTNISTNCLDRHLDGPGRHKAAIVWEGEPGDQRVLTYQQLHREVTRFAAALRAAGVEEGDRIAIYMGMTPEIAVAMLACARIGAVHSIVFAGFSAKALRDRIQDAGAKLVITADGTWRRGSVLPLKPAVDEAVADCPTIERVITLKRTGNDVAWDSSRDLSWDEAMALGQEAASKAREEGVDLGAAAELDSEHPLFILYTSGTTGKPKGVVHTTAGYMVQTAFTTRTVFDLKETDLYWCTADCGWITGHSYIVYGPMANGASVFMYEGAPNFPEPDRFWDLIARHQITIFYTAPTAIRAFIKWGDAWPEGHDLSSLRLLGTVGEPINPEAYMWYRKKIGYERCPIVDTWWQTETGSIMISSVPGVTDGKPGSASSPLPGVDAAIVTEDGQTVSRESGALLVIRKPWPSMLRTIYGDDERFKQQYFSTIPGAYFTGDGARQDADGDFWVMGRVDDVLNVSGHRLGTAEIESALVSHPLVAEAAVVGAPDELTGEAVFAFVTLEGGRDGSEELVVELRKHVAGEIGGIAKPKELRFAAALPKTRSGKIMRRLLRKIASGSTDLGDTSTLEDPRIVDQLQRTTA